MPLTDFVFKLNSEDLTLLHRTKTVGKPSTVLIYILYLKMQTLLRLTAPQTPRKPSVALTYKLDEQVQTLLCLPAPQTSRKPSAARGRSATYLNLSAPPGSDRGRRSDSVTPRPAVALSVPQDRDSDSHRDRDSTAQQLQFLSPPQPRAGAPVQHRRGAPALPRTRCSRAPTAPHRTPGSRQASAAQQPPRATLSHHSGTGLKGAAAERDALRSKHRNQRATGGSELVRSAASSATGQRLGLSGHAEWCRQ